MEGSRFVPAEGGNVFMVKISYRNFDNSNYDDGEAELVTLLGAAGDSRVLAEVPVAVFGDRGTKSFAIETFLPGYSGEPYKLNFILNGRFVASRTVRLSMPGW